MDVQAMDKLHSVYLFYGTETFRIEDALNKIKKMMKLEDASDSVVTFDLQEIPVERLVKEAETASLFGDSRLIIGKNATFVTAMKAKVVHQEQVLLSYLQQPLSSNVVVFIAPIDSLDKRKKITKALEKYAHVIHCTPLKGHDLYTWIVDCLQQHRITIQEDAIYRLIELVGDSLWLLHQECDKLATYVGKEGVITRLLVESLVPRTLEQDVFKLTDLIMSGKADQSLRLWRDLLSMAQEPLRILALITRQLRLTLHVQVLGKQQKSDKEIAAYLRVHPYPVKLARKQASCFSEKALRTYLYRAIQAEEEIKTGMVDKRIAVERLLLSMFVEYS